MKAVSLVAFFVSLLSFTSCDCKQEIAALQKENRQLKAENDSLKHYFASDSNAFKKQWYVPLEFRGNMHSAALTSGADYTGHILKEDANVKIKKFQTDANAIYDSYTIRADSIKRYLIDNPKVCDIHVYQASDGDQTTIIIIGVDEEGNHVYMKHADNSQYVFEHCQPCPTCFTSAVAHKTIKGQPRQPIGQPRSADTLEPQP